MKRFGPGIIVTAAFIGPGTVTTASLAGADFGFALTWALIFSIITTIVLQSMAARLGIVTNSGLAQALKSSIDHPIFRWAVLILVIVAIGVGSAAYQAGNLLGAALAGNLLTGISIPILSSVMGLIAFTLLYSGRYQLIETCLVVLVAMMSAVFIACVLLSPPDWQLVFSQFIPTSLSESANLTVIALIGTTVVPYNIFLHARTVQEKWHGVPTKQALEEALWDTRLSIGMGGIVTLAILSTAATAFFQHDIEVNIVSLSQQLEPILGTWSTFFFATGLLSAGLTSAITAPLAAAYAVCETFAWDSNLKSTKFRMVWLTVLIVGIVFAVTQSKPLNAIILAQAANGLILPLIAIALLWVMNKSDLMGEYKNSFTNNVAGVVILLVTIMLSGYKLSAVFGLS